MLVQGRHVGHRLVAKVADQDLGIRAVQYLVVVFGFPVQAGLNSVAVIVDQVVGQAAKVTDVSTTTMRTRKAHVLLAKRLWVLVFKHGLVGFHQGRALGAVAMRIDLGQ